MSQSQNQYDVMPYPVGTIDHSHPGRLGLMAQLFGMEPAPVERCRVLELGSGAGGNILPLAELFPESTFVGVDRASETITAGREWAERIGVKNITFVEADVATYDPGPEPFDYIIVHGLYSWVPDPVREQIMAVLGRALAPRGVAYVSYNVLPGCYTRRTMRDMMFFHTRGIEDRTERFAKARALTVALAEAVPEQIPVHKTIVVDQQKRLATLTDNYLVHDDLGEDWNPFYFHEFVTQAGRHGLQYLSEARYAEMSDSFLPPPQREWLRSVGSNVLDFEQHLDFIVGRSFRRTLLVREGVALERKLDGSTLHRTFAACAAWDAKSKPGHPPVPAPGSAPEAASASAPAIALAPSPEPVPDLASSEVQIFRNAFGMEMSLEAPFAKAAMMALIESEPRAFSFEELLEATRARLGATGEDDARELGEVLLNALDNDMVHLSTHRPRAAAQAGERPLATRFAREQVSSRLGLTTLFHQNVADLDFFARTVLYYCDGTRDRAAIAAEIGGGPIPSALTRLVRRGFILE